MIDINVIRTDSNSVKENLKKKFQDYKIPMVDEVLELDERNRRIKVEADDVRNKR
ncbi:MAG: serine--tRNA ligase, partial [Bacilli bacterium]|nr:serine--tRNA ligase [Bacilli bacterium]